MASIVNANTITVGASATTNISAVSGAGTRIHVRTPDTGVRVGGADLDNLGYGFDLVANTEYTFDLKPVVGTSASEDYSLMVKNTNGSGSVSVTWLAVPL